MQYRLSLMSPAMDPFSQTGLRVATQNHFKVQINAPTGIPVPKVGTN